MFTKAIGNVFASERAVERSDEHLSVGHRKQEATAQALLDYILKQDNEAEHFGRALKLPNARHLAIGKEFTLSSGRRVDHVISVDGRPIAFIEDKLWASFGIEQLHDYGRELRELSDDGRLIVIVPHRRRNAAQLEVDSSDISDFTTVLAWDDLPPLVKKYSAKPHLWDSLARFATEVGVNNLIDISSKGSFPQSKEIAHNVSRFLNSAAEIADLYLRERAAALGGQTRQSVFKFSTHKNNNGVWLQAGATQRDHWGLFIEPWDTGWSGIWLSHQSVPDDWDMRIGYFKHRLSAAARERVKEIARKGVNEDLELDLFGVSPYRLGTFLSPDEQSALKVLMEVFDFRSASLYLPRDTTFRGVNDGSTRFGMQFTVDENTVEAFMGPPLGTTWDRPSIFIRDDDGEVEIKPLKRDTGKHYVERVWQSINSRLTR